MDESWRMRMGLNNFPRRRSTEESASSISLSDRLMSSSSSRRRNSSSSSLFGLSSNSDIAKSSSSSSSSSSTSTTTSLLHLDPENFNDVFGGPPRSIVSRQFSRDDSSAAGNKSMNNNNTTTFYEEIFRSSEFVAQAKNNNHNGRKFPGYGYGIPERMSRGGGGEGGSGLRRRGDDGFYDDIFGSDNEDRRSPWKSESSKSNNCNLNYSKSKSKSNSYSSSVLSSEDLSPLRPSVAEDVFFTSKLRPINVSGSRNPSSMRVDEQHRRGVTSSDFPWITHPAPITDHHQLMEYDHNNIDLINESYKMSSSNRYGFSHSISSPETISIEPNSYRSCCIKIPMDDGLDIPHDLSPSSSVVSLHKDLAYDDQIKTHYQDKILQEEEEDDEEVMSSSYVIEFNNIRSSDQGMRSGEEAIGVDEAIAWAKEKFQSQCLEIFEGTNHQQQIMRLSRSPPEPNSTE